jgi:hypothetical protein
MSKAIHIKPNKWVLAEKHFGFWPKRITLDVSVTRPVRWMRIGLFPGYGSFKGSKNTFVFWGVLFLKSYEYRTCTVRRRGEISQYDHIDVDTQHAWTKDLDSARRLGSKESSTRRRSRSSGRNYVSIIMILTSLISETI